LFEDYPPFWGSKFNQQIPLSLSGSERILLYYSSSVSLENEQESPSINPLSFKGIVSRDEYIF
jgi:hypothetical protein